RELLCQLVKRTVAQLDVPVLATRFITPVAQRFPHVPRFRLTPVPLRDLVQHLIRTGPLYRLGEKLGGVHIGPRGYGNAPLVLAAPIQLRGPSPVRPALEMRLQQTALGQLVEMVRRQRAPD